jgi:hypothetical protein
MNSRGWSPRLFVRGVRRLILLRPLTPAVLPVVLVLLVLLRTHTDMGDHG